MRTTSSPLRALSFKLFWNRVQALIRKTALDDCEGIAAEMAYNLILASIPMTVFLVALLGLIGGQKAVYPLLIEFIQRVAPIHTTELLISTIDATIQGSSAGLTLLGLLGTLWSVSSVGRVIIKGLQRAYGLDRQSLSFWRLLLLSGKIILLMGSCIISASYLLIFGEFLIDWLNQAMHLPWNAVILLQCLRWLTVISSIFWMSAYFYALILHPRTGCFSWKKAFSGALFFVFAWLSVSFMFSLYVERLQQFNPVYGALGALIILVTWLYYSSLVFLIGAEITALQANLSTECDPEPLENR